MFSEKDMTVSLPVANKKILEVKQEMQLQIDEAKRTSTEVINAMKRNHRVKGTLSIHFSRSVHKVGEPTGLFKDGIELFTGDEVQFIYGGGKGVIVSDSGKIYVDTNCGHAELVTPEKYRAVNNRYLSCDGYTSTDMILLLRHFNTYAHGDEIAAGRKGGAGFIFSETTKESDGDRSETES